MHMWMWFGYDLGEFLFPGLNITLRWQFAVTWIVLFVVALLFEGSKVYVAKVQREAHKKLYPFRSNERRNLLCDRERLHRLEEPGSSRNASTAQVRRWTSLKLRLMLNTQQTLVVALHNTVGYVLMLAVMVYNVHLLIAVVLGMMMGYFLFGPKLTRFQMQCYSTTRVVICTPECDDTAEGTTPPLLASSASSESDLFACRTRTCVQPSHYFPAQGPSTEHNTCYYGAKQCPSMVARAKRLQASAVCHRVESEKEDSPSIEDAQLLRTEKQKCCKKKQEPPDTKCCKSEDKPDLATETAVSPDPVIEREESPHITCCHATAASSDSQEQIVK